jgi:glycosyltransferase involved in cell wall biosynthesis
MSGPVARRLSILHLITRLERGGSSDCTLWQAIGAARRGHAVTVASGPTEAPTPLLQRAARVEGLELVTLPSLARPVRPWRDLRAFAEIRRLLRSARFDIVHTHTSKAGALGRLAAGWSGTTVIHQPHGHLFYGYYGPALTAGVIAAERILARLCRLQIVLSQRGAEEHLGRGIGVPEGFRVVRSGIDLKPLRAAWRRRIDCRSRLGFRPEDMVVGALCRLEAIKGSDLLLEGFARAAASRPRLRLFLGGDGPLRGVLLERAAGAGISGRVIIGTGWLSPADVLPAFDLYVQASRNDGMGRALVEAMACGLPVLATDVGGVGEVLEEGRSGLLVPPDDPVALAEAIGRLADDPALAARLARAARARAVLFGAGRMNHRLLRIYDEVAS